MLKSAVFAGARCTRAPYWVTIGILLVGKLVVNKAVLPTLEWPVLLVVAIGWVIVSSYIWLVVCAARMRDAGESGWLALMTLIPLFGWIMALVYEFKRTATPDDESSSIAQRVE